MEPDELTDIPRGYKCIACHEFYLENPGPDCKVCECELSIETVFDDDDELNF